MPRQPRGYKGRFEWQDKLYPQERKSLVEGSHLVHHISALLHRIIMGGTLVHVKVGIVWLCSHCIIAPLQLKINGTQPNIYTGKFHHLWPTASIFLESTLLLQGSDCDCMSAFVCSQAADFRQRQLQTQSPGLLYRQSVELLQHLEVQACSAGK